MAMNPRPFHMSSGLMASSATFLAAAAAAPSSTTTLRDYMPSLSSSSSSSSPSASLGFLHYIHSTAPQPASSPTPPPQPAALLQRETTSLSYVTGDNYALASASADDVGYPLTKPFLPSTFPAADGRRTMGSTAPCNSYEGEFVRHRSLPVEVLSRRLQGGAMEEGGSSEPMQRSSSESRTGAAAAAAAADKLYVLQQQQQEGSISQLHHQNHHHHYHQQRSRLQATPAYGRDPVDPCCEPIQVRNSSGGSPVLQLKSCSVDAEVMAAMGISTAAAVAAAASSDLGLMLGHGSAAAAAIDPVDSSIHHAPLKQRKRGRDLLLHDQISAAAATDSQRLGLLGGECAALGGLVALSGFPPTAAAAAAGIDSILCRARAKRGCATHPRSIAERVRRTKISERMKKLQDLVPNLDKQAHTADMLDEVVEYVKQLQQQVQVLSQTTSKCKGMCQNRGRISDNKDGNERTK